MMNKSIQRLNAITTILDEQETNRLNEAIILAAELVIKYTEFTNREKNTALRICVQN